MQITMLERVTKNVTHVAVSANVRYWEDSEIDGVADETGSLTPCRSGENWEPIIDIETGVITNWQQGVSANIHFKVCDAGCYKLLSGSEVIAEKDGYVPRFLCPSENGYGDYIIMKIDGGGKIENWSFKFDEEYWSNED